MELLEGKQMKNNLLNNKVIVVTGGLSGIGKAIVEYLFDKGANVVNADISVTRGKTVKVYNDRHVKKLIEVNLDVRDKESWKGLFNAVMNEFGKADILINCAGVVIPDSLISSSPDMLKDQIDVNLLGPINGVHTFLPLFVKQKSGHIINIASLAGIVPIPGESIYSASKFGLRGYTMALALELKGTGVNVTSVCPDSVITPQLIVEAHHTNSGFSFSGKLLDAKYVASKIYGTILHPRNEISVTRFRGFQSRLFGNSNILMNLTTPMIKVFGERNRKKFLKNLENKEIKNACLS
jgi:NAD(P)-dependent dehydrogenase (short-subunit alcohol dehydrogenase family)